MSISSLHAAAGGAAPPKAYAGPALFSIGFRPFYLLAAAAAALMIPCWLLVFFGIVPAHAYFSGSLWHAHEMLFGYAAAVLVGFLFTAIPNWTGRPTPRGLPLAALAALWLLGRIAVLAGGGWPPALVAAIDVSFLPLAALGMLPPLLRTRNRRNIAFPFALLGLAALNGMMHLEQAGAAFSFDVARAALAVLAVVLVVMTGRVVPAFTGNALPGAGVGRSELLDKLALASVIVSLAASAFLPETAASGAASLAAGALLVARMIPWKPLATVGVPMLWILHLGHFWIAVAFLMRGAADLGVPMLPSLPDHALTVGAIGGLTLGMMARSALGHTGRRIVAGPWLATSFVCVNVAAWARSLAPLMVPSHFERATVVATVFWSLAFTIFLVVFVPKLVAPRADAKPRRAAPGGAPAQPA